MSFSFFYLLAFAQVVLSQSDAVGSSQNFAVPRITTIPTLATSVKENAIVPTSAGQIGINPVIVPNIPVKLTGASNTNPDPSTAPPTATTTITVKGTATAVSYVPDDLTFEIAADGSVTLQFGEWILQQLQEAAKKTVACSLSRLKSRQSTTICGVSSYLENIAANEPLVIRVIACTPPPLEQALIESISADAQLVSGFESLGISIGTGTVAISGAGTALVGAFGAIYLTWVPQSSGIGSNSAGINAIPSVITVDGGDDANHCPEDVLDYVQCDDPSCNGASDNKARGGVCTVNGPNKGCSCISKPTIYVHPANQQIMDLASGAPADEGLCSFNLTQYNSCEYPWENMYATIVFNNPSNQTVASEPNMTHIDDANPWVFPTPYGDLRITGEHNTTFDYEYVQFNLGDDSWTSSNQDTSNTSFCTTTAWNWRVPNCGSIFESKPTINRLVTCTFQCTLPTITLPFVQKNIQKQ